MLNCILQEYQNPVSKLLIRPAHITLFPHEPILANIIAFHICTQVNLGASCVFKVGFAHKPSSIADTEITGPPCQNKHSMLSLFPVLLIFSNRLPTFTYLLPLLLDSPFLNFHQQVKQSSSHLSIISYPPVFGPFLGNPSNTK